MQSQKSREERSEGDFYPGVSERCLASANMPLTLAASRIETCWSLCVSCRSDYLSKREASSPDETPRVQFSLAESEIIILSRGFRWQQLECGRKNLKTMFWSCTSCFLWQQGINWRPEVDLYAYPPNCFHLLSLLIFSLYLFSWRCSLRLSLSLIHSFFLYILQAISFLLSLCSLYPPFHYHLFVSLSLIRSFFLSFALHSLLFLSPHPPIPFPV